MSKTVQGIFQYSSGQPVSGGKVTFTAKTGANYSGLSILSNPGCFSTTLASDGSFSLSMIASDECTPQVLYTMSVYDAAGNWLINRDVLIIGTNPISLTDTPSQNSGTAFPPQYSGGASLKTIQGTFKYNDGTPVANSSVTFTLSQPALLTGTGTQIVPKSIVAALDSNGNMPGGFQLYGNDVLSPYTVYLAVVKDTNGNQLSSETFSIAGSTPISLNQLVEAPVSGFTDNTIPGIFWAQYNWSKVFESLASPLSWNFTGAPSFSSKNLWASGVLEGLFEFTATMAPVPLDVAKITSWSIKGNVLTVTAFNDFKAGAPVLLTGLTTGSYLNNIILQVASFGLSSSQFICGFTHADVPTVTESGLAQITNTGALDIAAITSWSISGNVLTVMAANDFVAGATVFLTGLTTGSYLNNIALVINASGLSSSQFKCNFTHVDVSTVTESGLAQVNQLPTLTLHWTDPTLGAQSETIFSSSASITAWVVAGNIVSFTASNTFLQGQLVAISGLTTGSFMNGLVLPVYFTLSPNFTYGPSASFFCVLPDYTHSGDSATENGTALALTPPTLPISVTYSGQIKGCQVKAGTDVSISLANEAGVSFAYSLFTSLDYISN